MHTVTWAEEETVHDPWINPMSDTTKRRHPAEVIDESSVFVMPKLGPQGEKIRQLYQQYGRALRVYNDKYKRPSEILLETRVRDFVTNQLGWPVVDLSIDYPHDRMTGRFTCSLYDQDGISRSIWFGKNNISAKSRDFLLHYGGDQTPVQTITKDGTMYVDYETSHFHPERNHMSNETIQLASSGQAHNRDLHVTASNALQEVTSVLNELVSLSGMKLHENINPQSAGCANYELNQLRLKLVDIRRDVIGIRERFIGANVKASQAA